MSKTAQVSQDRSVFNTSLLPEFEYQSLFSCPHISEESIDESSRGGIIVYIETYRFTAKSLYSPKTKFDEYSDEIQQLYKVTFCDKTVMEKFVSGVTKTQDEFVTNVNLQSLRWSYGYKFAGFIITDNSNDNVVGYEVIGNSGISNKGEIAYLFNKDYHRTKDMQNVGYENVGALVLEYGKELYKSKQLVNQGFNHDKTALIGEEALKGVVATAKDDNLGSCRILEKTGFFYTYDTFKF